MTEPQGPLSGVTIVDLGRILAGPTATQLLGDLGAEVIKIEKPGTGDDTRGWGPPYLKAEDGSETSESAYYLSSNRNKRSVTIDIARPEGAAIVRRLLDGADILLQNFKVGGLAKYGLDYESLKDAHPRLVYCSISGFGQTGPYRHRAGYDLLAQGMGGIMSVTGEADRDPQKVGTGIADVMCGMYATVAILAALRHRDLTGEGQHIDLALLDAQVAWLINIGVNYLTSGKVPHRMGNAHPNIVPYDVFPTADGYVIIAAGNDGQYRRLVELAGRPELADDPRFRTNADRVRNRDALNPMLRQITVGRTTAEWLEGLERVTVPASPVNTVDQVFADPQILHRGMKLAMPHPTGAGGVVPLIGNPLKLSATPVTYRRPPPLLGEHTDEVLEEKLGLTASERDRLRADGVI